MSLKPHLHALKKSARHAKFLAPWWRFAQHSQFSMCKRIGPKCNVAPVLKILGVLRLPPRGSLGTGKRGTIAKIWRAVPMFLARVKWGFRLETQVIFCSYGKSVNTIVCFLHSSVCCLAELCIFLCGMLWGSLGCGCLKEQHQNFDQTCLVSLLCHDSHNFATYLMLSWIGKWFLMLSGKVKLQKHFGAVGLFFKLDVNREPAESTKKRLSGHVW